MLHAVSNRIVENIVNFPFNAPPVVSLRKDKVQRYACQLLSIGCFYLVYKGAIKEGDGQRVLEC